jgi:spore coat protein A
MLTRREFLRLGAMMGAGVVLPMGFAEKALAFNLLGQAEAADPTLLSQFVDPLPVMPAMPQKSRGYYEVGAYRFTAKVHRDVPATTVWGYRPTGWDPGPSPENTYLGPSFVVRQGMPIRVRWLNKLVDGAGAPIPHPLPVDPSLHWAGPLGDNMMPGPFPVDGEGKSTFDYTLDTVPLVPHVHGGEQEPGSDGGPDAWFTPGFARKGATWTHEVYRYTNGQPPTTIWYHDHALGMTRLNVYMGLAGAYVVTNPDTEPKGLPSGAYDIPLVIQDRMLDVDGQWYFPAVSAHPAVNPFWVPEFFGDHVLVNGKVWPYLDVEPRAYRFRILDGSNARFYGLWLEDDHSGAPGPAFFQIATDGGYLNQPVKLNDPADPLTSPRLMVAPGERAECVIDFSGHPGRSLILRNSARGPFPAGDPAVPETVGKIMMFRVQATTPTVYSFPTDPLNPALASYATTGTPTLGTTPSVTPAGRVRILTLNEVMDAGGPLAILLNLTRWMAPITELPEKGATEIWKIVNTTMDTHPIHLHLTQFQLVSRQAFDTTSYDAAFMAANGMMPIDGMMIDPATKLPRAYEEVDPGPFLEGPVKRADPNERGWKDTVRMNPGEVTTIVARFAPVDGTLEFPFDCTALPGYVWHCHIIDHEDNEMMRPYRVALSSTVTGVAVQGATRYETAVEASRVAFASGSAGSVVLATGRNWPDALGGAALAGAIGGPIMLCEKDSVPSAVMGEISRLGAKNVYILGGGPAVSNAVATALKNAGKTVTRIGGANRYATARLVAAKAVELLGTGFDGTAFVATGLNFPDALAGSPISAARGWPIYLIDPATTASSTIASMTAAGVTKVRILGGDKVVPTSVESELKGAFGAGNVLRLSGADRYGTAAAIAEYGVVSAGMRWNGVGIATGRNFPDALAGGVMLGKAGSVLLLTPGTTLASTTRRTLSGNKASVDTVYFLGGPSAVAESVRTEVKAALR